MTGCGFDLENKKALSCAAALRLCVKTAAEDVETGDGAANEDQFHLLCNWQQQLVR